NSAHGNSRDDELQDNGEHENGGEKSAGGRKRKRTENIVEQELRAVANSAHAAGNILHGSGLRSGYANAHGQIRGRQIPRHAGQQHGELAVTLQLFAAITARFEMLTNMHALFDRGGAGYSVIEIAGELGLHRVALHGSSPCANIPEFVPISELRRKFACEL